MNKNKPFISGLGVLRHLVLWQKVTLHTFWVMNASTLKMEARMLALVVRIGTTRNLYT